MDDHVLLQAYLEHRSEQAFADLVERHLSFVYATALHLVRDPHTAQDVAQTVFIQLARKPWVVYGGHALPGWLYRATQHAAFSILRGEKRRRQRETEAMKLAEQNQEPAGLRDPVEPVLDEALQCLSRIEQDAVLLRYYQGKSYREIGVILDLNENAAHKRVERALEKVRHFFARRGVTTTAALLASAITARAAAPLPVGLTAAKVTGASLASSAGEGGLADAMGRLLYMTTKTKIIVAAATIAVLAAILLNLPFWQNSSPGASTPQPLLAASKPTLITAPTSPRIAAPVVPPQAPNPTNPAASPWKVGAYLASSDWQDVGTDSPEDALQTILWARQTNNPKRRMAISVTHQVDFNASSRPNLPTGGWEPTSLPSDEEVLAALSSSGLPNDNRRYVILSSPSGASVVDPSRLDYSKLLGAKIVSQTQVAPNKVSFEVDENWSEAQGDLGSETQERFEFVNTPTNDPSNPAKEVAPATWLFTEISVHIVTDKELEPSQ